MYSLLCCQTKFSSTSSKKKKRKFLWYYFNSGEMAYRFDDKLTLVYKHQELTLESRNVYKHPRNPLSFCFFPFMDVSVRWHYSACFFLQQPILEDQKASVTSYGRLTVLNDLKPSNYSSFNFLENMQSVSLLFLNDPHMKVS